MKKFFLFLVAAVFSAMAFAQAPIPSTNPQNQFAVDWWRPKAVNVDLLAAKPVHMFEASPSGNTGVRLYTRWQFNPGNTSIGMRLGYIQFGSTTYDMGAYNGSTGDDVNGIFDMLAGSAVRDGDRRQHGFPSFAHKITWAPRGIEVGPDFRVMLDKAKKWEFHGHAVYIFDLSSMPEISGFSIPDAKLERKGGSGYGLGVSYKVSSNVEASMGYERTNFSSYVSGGPTAWQPNGGKYINGLRSYDSLVMSVGVTF